MASLTIRNFDDALKTSLRLQAARHGHSMEQEAREILRRAVQLAASEADFAKRLQKRFSGLAVEKLPIPKRRAARIPATPKP
jgi:plasmid stability protein